MLVCTAARVSCDQCQIVRINGIPCHETGCPDSWDGATGECENCGCEFELTHRGHSFCDDSCAASYHGWPSEDAMEEEEDDQD